MSRSEPDARRRRSAPTLRDTANQHVPLCERIRADIEERILSGAWGPGHRIPFEHELVTQYKCSRMTVHKAMNWLAEAGLVVRRRRLGTVVAKPHIQVVALNIPDIQAEITSRGESYDYRLLAARRRAPRIGVQAEIELAAGGELFSIRCVHLASGRPFVLESRLISLAAVPELANVDFNEVSPGTWLFEHVSWTEASHRITALNADERIAKALKLPRGAACLSLERETWRGGERITIVRQVFVGDEFELVAKFAPARA